MAILSLFRLKRAIPAVCFIVFSCESSFAFADSDGKVIAQIGDTEITARDFSQYYDRARRRQFYHGAPPGEREAAFRREVAQALISRVLLLQEAERRGLKPDRKKVQTLLAHYEKRYADNARWKRDRQQLLDMLKTSIEEDDLLSQLETRVRRIQLPTPKQLQNFYRTHPSKFTEPARQRLSLILLQVAPSSPPAMWDAARAEARKLVVLLRNGADFAELARLHSGDVTAQNGGDMGYLHKGMLSEQAERAIDKLAPGAVSDPITVLEGVAIFRLVERKPATLQPFAKIEARAREMWLREQGETAWLELQQRLRTAASIKIYDQSLFPQPSA